MNGRRFSPLHVGQILGTLRKVGEACQGSYGAGYESSTGDAGPTIGLATDRGCRVYVEEIVFGEKESPLPSGGRFVTPTQVP